MKPHFTLLHHTPLPRLGLLVLLAAVAGAAAYFLFG